MPPKIAMIGAGSIGFTRKLVQDILTVLELSARDLADGGRDAGGAGAVAAAVSESHRGGKTAAGEERAADEEVAGRCARQGKGLMAEKKKAKTVTCPHCRYDRPAKEKQCLLCGYPWPWVKKKRGRV